MLTSAQQMPDLSDLENIRILNRVRLVALVGQSCLILFAIVYLQITLPIDWIAGVFCIQLVLQVVGIWLVGQKQQTSHWQLFTFIALDSIFLACLVYFTGGANNPFIYLLLLFVALASFMLMPRYLLLISILELVLYSLLNLYQRPNELGEQSPLASFHLHLAGMWVNFILTVVLIAFFGLLTRFAMLRQEKQLQRLREKQLQDEQVLGLGIMAASAAHELGTPLSTMAIVVEDLQHQKVSPALSQDMKLLMTQIAVCKKIIGGLQDKSQHAKQQIAVDESESLVPIQGQFEQSLISVIDNWLVCRPNIQLKQSWRSNLDNKSVAIPISVEQAITNLLDNAADASLENQSDKIELTVDYNSHSVVIEILDYGAGIQAEQRSSLGLKIQQSQKSKGLGWGTFLSNVSIERAGGRIELGKSQWGGTITRIILPEAQ
ncbi:MAG: ATP-binding protein [Kangiellaceae bacterium]|nr:ATP-binding protein [Kangiellaceae bacterium]